MNSQTIQNNIDSLFTKAGQYHRYQCIIVASFFLLYICSQFFNNNFSYLTSRPFININNADIRLDPKICKQYFNDSINDIKLNENQIPTTSMILDLKIYCDSSKIYLIKTFFYLGIIIGSCISYHFHDKLGSKLTLGIFIPNYIICLVLFQLLNFENIQNNYYFICGNLFFLGQSEYIILNILLLYICDITRLFYIPIFITIIISGKPISYYFGLIFFNVIHLNWKIDLLIVAGINLIIFVFTLIYMVSSPKAALRNKNYIYFTKNLLQISKKNNKKLNKKDFDFLLPFMNSKEIIEYESIFLDFSKIKNDNIDINAIIDDDNDSINDINNSFNIKDSSLFNDEPNKGKISIKDDYLLSDDNNNINSYKNLFSKVRMKDYSPLDLLIFKTQAINFFTLSFLWAAYNFIKYGLDLTIKKIPEYNDTIAWETIIHLTELFSSFIVMLLYIKYKKAFQKILVTFQLITFITLMLAIHFYNGKKNINRYILSLIIVQISWNSLYLLHILISLLIYPIMLRSKGFGLNIGLGTIGKLAIMFLIDFRDENEYILYFIIFDFFVMVFSYALPDRIGSFVIDLGEKNKKEQEKNNGTNIGEMIELRELTNLNI